MKQVMMVVAVVLALATSLAPDRSTCRENMRASYRREAVEVYDGTP